ncbi:MAG: prepilin-type N-terminal cleavage/methylation domain-containing protein [Phycisphaerales bacterium]
MTPRAPGQRPRVRPGFSLAEVAVATVVLGIMLGAAIQTVAASRAGQVWNAERLKGLALASGLMSEITDRYYGDPAAAIVLFGPEVGEDQAVRTTLNDVDDYRDLKGVPTARDGTEIPGLAGWSRTVEVAWVGIADPSVVSLVETGMKRVTVTVYRGKARLAELVRYRTAAIPR